MTAIFRPVAVMALALAVLALGSVAPVAETLPGPIAALVVRVLDGDTLEVRARVWLSQDVAVGVRLLGVDAPEIKGKCAAEIAKAQEARALVERLAPAGSVVRLRGIKPDKYAGRVDAEVEVSGGRDLAGELIAAGLARPYAGGQRKGWCE